ncbi:MAG TPA: hypothetical protein VD978_08325 [Azospirillum sp.]|nr:hypothetical protein [Azospirillum sp.]
MPLLARAADGTVLQAWVMPPAAWEELKGTYRDRGLTAPCCGRAVVPVRSPNGWAFFRHAPGGTCQARESLGHVVGKSIIARAAAALGFTVTTEARGDGWVADVLVEAPRWRVAVEVQLSRVARDVLDARQRRYADSGVRGAWLLGYDMAGPADPALPAFRLLAGRDDRAEPEVAPMGASGRRARLGLADFVTRLLTGGVRFVPAAAGPHLVLQAATCPRCRRDVVVPVGVGTVAGHPILAPGGFLAAPDLGKVPAVRDAYRAAVPALVRRRPDVAVLREDRRDGRGWTPRCPDCDSALPLGRLDRRTPHPPERCALDGAAWPEPGAMGAGWVWR